MHDAPASRQLNAGNNVASALRVAQLPRADGLDVVMVGDGNDAHSAISRGVAPLLGMKQPIAALCVQMEVGVRVTVWRRGRTWLLVDPDRRQHCPLIEVLADQRFQGAGE